MKTRNTQISHSSLRNHRLTRSRFNGYIKNECFQTFPTPSRADDDHGTPVSVRIRERLRAARRRYHANDNIADCIRPGELAVILREISTFLNTTVPIVLKSS